VSRGHGAVERAILENLAHNKCAIVEDLAKSVAGTAAPDFVVSDALRSSINRALRKLARSGLIYEYDRLGPTKYWALVANKEKKRRRSREQARQERYEEALREAQRRAEAQRQKTDATAQLKKVLGMLGSDHDGEVLTAARQAEAIRRKLKLTWDELLTGKDVSK
jgi:hypothetical protein